MALQGTLEDFDLNDVFQLIQLGQKDGGLKIRTDEDTGLVYFKGGMVVHAKTSFAKGESAIDSILTWKKGSFIFNPNEETIEHTVDLPIQQVILEAARRIDELTKIQKLIPSFNSVVKIVEVPDAGVEKIQLRPEEWKVLSFVDGLLTIKEIASRAHISEFETSRILYGLISSGLVTLAVKPEPLRPVDPKEETKEEPKEDNEGGGLFSIFRKK
jgi:AraC-like DNA-binding protein